MGILKKIGLSAIASAACLMAVTGPASASALTYTNQDVTAYVATGTLTSDGTNPFWGVIAVNSTSGCCTPIVPYGTEIDTQNYIQSPIGSGNTFFVHDTGNGSGLSKYWIDIYWGDWLNQDSALSFGDQKQSLTVHF